VHEVASLKDPEDITWVHFEGRIPDILLNAIPQIRPLLLPHATISIECEKPDRSGLMELIPLADVIFFSHTYFIHFQSKHSGSDPSTSSFFSFMRAKNSHAIFIVTTGADGALYSIPGEEGTVPTSQVDLVDSTGAGDTFIAGFIWARGKLGKSVKESVEFAVGLATKKVAQEGFDGVWNEREG
jgi:ketohexokinase